MRAYVVGVKRKVLLVYEVGVKIHFSPNTGVGLWAKIPNTSTFVARALGYSPLVLTIPEQRQNPPMSTPNLVQNGHPRVCLLKENLLLVRDALVLQPLVLLPLGGEHQLERGAHQRDGGDNVHLFHLRGRVVGLWEGI